jgi:hypothetical protein
MRRARVGIVRDGNAMGHDMRAATFVRRARFTWWRAVHMSMRVVEAIFGRACRRPLSEVILQQVQGLENTCLQKMSVGEESEQSSCPYRCRGRIARVIIANASAGW